MLVTIIHLLIYVFQIFLWKQIKTLLSVENSVYDHSHKTSQKESYWFLIIQSLSL